MSHILIFLCFLFHIVTSYKEMNWLPTFANESLFDEPFDYFSDAVLPDLVSSGTFDWISSSGTTLNDIKKSYIAFTGTRSNKAKDFSSVFTKESGILVLCESTLSETESIKIDCKTLEERSLESKTGVYFGSAVRSVKFNQDTAAFVYCDPLWFNYNSKFKEPSGKCKLSFIKDFRISNAREFELCNSYKKCLGGFSVDIYSDSQNLDLLFGLPFSNSTMYLKQAQSNAIAQAREDKGEFFNFGYAVSFANDGSLYVSSPVSDENSAFVKIINGVQFYPQDKKTQKFGGFGLSIDTINVGNKLYGALIGAPYQSKQGLANVGAVSLACKGYKTDMVMGEAVYDYFGYAVARLGDVDFDGSEEFAVSAPSLNLEKPGKIYIFKTTSQCTIQKKPIQVFRSNILGFGASISRGFDIDFNGWPDFFVTSLNSKKAALFTMPSQQKVSCYWITKEVTEILEKDQTFDVKIKFQTETEIDFKDYFFQVALDFKNINDRRFQLIGTDLRDGYFSLKIKMLEDAIDMDFRSTPFFVAIKGTRACKKNAKDSCFESKSVNIKWSGCEQNISLPQFVCTKKCLSDMVLTLVPDLKGPIIYLGDQKNYIRKLQIKVRNLGPETSPRTYLSVRADSDLMITNVLCDAKCQPLLSTSGQNATVVVKDSITENSEVTVEVEVLFTTTKNETRSETGIAFSVWGVNEDQNVMDNHLGARYSVLFKPDLVFSSKKTQNTIIDPREKPPYLSSYGRVPVHDLGTELKFSYIIENKGPELTNVDFKFKFPFKTKDGKLLLYVLDRIRMTLSEQWVSALPTFSRNNDIVTHCSIAPEFINPLKVIAMESHKHNNATSVPDRGGRRLKRFVSEDNGKVVTFSDLANHTSSIETPLAQSEGAGLVSPSSGRSTLVGCDSASMKLGIVVCAEVVCKLDRIPNNSTFNFDFRTWVFTKTFFEAKLPDIIISTSLESNLGQLPTGVKITPGADIVGPFTMSHNVLFSKMVIREDKPLPLWPIILAVIIGIILLVIIIIVAYYCGFFKRKRLKEQMKKKRQEKKQLEMATNEKVPLNSS